MSIFKKLSALAGALVLSLSAVVQAGNDTETDSNDVILSAHDAVAYFTEGKPVEGSADYTAVHNGAIYRFSSADNRDAFRDDPARYAPQYGGFCAYGMTFGKKFEVNGKAWEIVDGRLYVNKNEEVYEAWAKEIPKHISEANAKWPTVEQTDASEL